MHDQTAEAPRWVGYILLIVGTLLFVFGKRLMLSWAAFHVKQREQFIARLPFLQAYVAAPTTWDAKVATVFIYLFAGVSLFASAMTLFRR